MNKNYRVVWSPSLGNFIVTSELARGKARSAVCSGSGKYRAVSVLCSALLLGCSGSVLAAPNPDNGVSVSGPGNDRLVEDVTVDATKDNAYGFYAEQGGSLASSNVDVFTSGQNGYGVYATDAGSVITMTQGSVSTTGDNAAGLVADNGGKVTSTNIYYNTSGDNAYAVHVSGAQSEATLTGANVTTTGNQGHGLLADGGGRITSNRVNYNVTGTDAWGVYATGADTTIAITGGSVKSNSHGLVAADQGTVTADNVRVNTEGHALLTSNGTLTAKNMVLTSTGGFGAYATGANAHLTLTASKITASGNNNAGAGAFDGALVNLSNNDVNVSDNAAGLTAGLSGHLTADDTRITGTDGSIGLHIQNSSSLTANNLNITLSNSKSDGLLNTGVLFSGNSGETGLATITDTDIAVSGLNAVGIKADRLTSTAELNNVRIEATDGIAIQAVNGAALTVNADNSQLGGETLLQTGYVEGGVDADIVQYATVNASNQSVLSGDVNIDRSQTSDSQINLDTGSQWRGAAHGLHSATLQNNSLWRISGDSDVGGLTSSHSTVAFEHNDDSFKTLTVDGNYHGDNSTLVMHTALGDDNSATDKLHITGNSSGTTLVTIANAGGSGAQTINGIQVIQVDGNSDGEFRQQGRIVAGAYDYELARGNGANDRNWYLNSSLPGDRADDDASAPQIVRPEAAGYLANLAAANTLFSTSMADRTGASNFVDATGQAHATSLWLRNQAGHTRFRDSSDQLKTNSNRYAIQLGSDLLHGGFSEADAMRLGAMVGYGTVHSKTRSDVTGYVSKAQIHGYSAGVYGNWWQNAAEQSGAYVDGWALYNWFDNSVKGDAIHEESYKSKGVTASVETGYSARVAAAGDNYGVWLRPKAQLTWMGVKTDTVKEQNGTRVDASGENNVQSSLGLRASLQNNQPAARTLHPYAEVNWLHNSKAFGTTLNGITINQAGARNVAEMKVGVDATLNQRVSLWGNVAQQVGGHHYSDTSAVAGVKISF